VKVLLDYPSADNESQVLRPLREEEQALGARTAAVQGFALAAQVPAVAIAPASAGKLGVTPVIQPGWNPPTTPGGRFRRNSTATHRR
jgi:hypothetical protein